MSYLIKWKLEKLLNRRGFGESALETPDKSYTQMSLIAKRPDVTEYRRVRAFRVIVHINIRRAGDGANDRTRRIGRLTGGRDIPPRRKRQNCPSSTALYRILYIVSKLFLICFLTANHGFDKMWATMIPF